MTLDVIDPFGDVVPLLILLPSFLPRSSICSHLSYHVSNQFTAFKTANPSSLCTCHASPVSQRSPPNRWRAAPTPTTTGPQGPRSRRAHQAFRPVPFCPALPWQTCPCPRRAAPASATACATTLTPTPLPRRRVHSIYECKTTHTESLTYTH